MRSSYFIFHLSKYKKAASLLLFLCRLLRIKAANIFIEKTESSTGINGTVNVDEVEMEITLLEKKNYWWYDYAYKFAEESRWLTNDKLGINCNYDEVDKVLKANYLL